MLLVVIAAGEKVFGSVSHSKEGIRNNKNTGLRKSRKAGQEKITSLC